MGITLYDTPAQAEFINTYVPIQFERLYGLADKAQKELDAVELLYDETTRNYQSLNTPSKKDKGNWDGNVYGDMRSFVDSEFNSEEDMKDPVKRAKYMAKVREIKNNPRTAELMNSAAELRASSKNSDPRWGEFERNKLANYDTSKSGVFQGGNMIFEGWDKIEAEIFKGLDPKGTDKGIVNGWQITGWDSKDIHGILDQNDDIVSQNQFAKNMADKAMFDGTLDPKYIKKDGKGNILADASGNAIIDVTSFAKDNLYGLSIHRERMERDYIGDKLAATAAHNAARRASEASMRKAEEDDGSAVQYALDDARAAAASKVKGVFWNELDRQAKIHGTRSNGPLGRIGVNWYLAAQEKAKAAHEVDVLRQQAARLPLGAERTAAQEKMKVAMLRHQKAVSVEDNLQEAVDFQIEAEMNNMRHPVTVNGKPVTPISKEMRLAITKANVVPMDPAVIIQATKALSSSEYTLTSKDGTPPRTFYVPLSVSEYTVMDRNTGLPFGSSITNDASAVGKLDRLMKSGALDGKVSHSPNGMVSLDNDRQLAHSRMRVSSQDLEDRGFTAADLKYLVDNKIASTSEVVLKEEDKYKGIEADIQTMYEISVAPDLKLNTGDSGTQQYKIDSKVGLTSRQYYRRK